MTYPTDPADLGATSVNPRPQVEGVPIGDLVSDVTRDLSTLMRQELALAKAEMKQEATKTGKAAGMLGGAGYAAHLLVLFLSLTLMWLLDEVLALWLAALIVALLWGITAAALYVTGRKKLAQVNPKPEQTVESLKEDVQWAKTRTR